jgi:hypothetical protein
MKMATTYKNKPANKLQTNLKIDMLIRKPFSEDHQNGNVLVFILLFY